MFNAWKEKFKDNIVDMGGKLKPGGKIVTASGVTDGPFVEAKEIVGGYMIVAAESYERALEVAREVPGLMMPGSSIEIREMAGPERRLRQAPGAPAAPGRALLPARLRPAGGHARAQGRACGISSSSRTRSSPRSWPRSRRGRARACPTTRARGSTGSPHNQLIGDLRRKAGRLRILEQAAGAARRGGRVPARRVFADEVRDDMLRMLFVCCDDAIPRESAAGAGAEDAVRLQHGGDRAAALHRPKPTCTSAWRARASGCAKSPPDVETPPLETLRSRLPSVHAVLYLLFNEGYLSAHADRRSAASSATRPSGSPRCSPSIRWAQSRRPSPCSRSCICTRPGWGRASTRLGGLLLLEEQDRSLWDRERIAARRASGWRARPAATCSPGSMRRPASPPSIASRPRSSRHAGRRSPTSTRCSSASPLRPCTR